MRRPIVAAVTRPYRDRREAGAALAALLGRYAGRLDVTVLGLARGGVPVAAEIAGRLGAPFDVLVVRKLGLPDAPEVAFGAIGVGGVIVRTALARRVSAVDAAAVLAVERTELDRRDRLYHAGRGPEPLAGRTVILTDDGLATGATARAAIAVVRRLNATAVVLAAPVGAASAIRMLRRAADEVVCPLVPRRFAAVGQFYRDFHPVPDAEIQGLLS